MILGVNFDFRFMSGTIINCQSSLFILLYFLLIEYNMATESNLQTETINLSQSFGFHTLTNFSSSLPLHRMMIVHHVHFGD
jgi:hypothetical protein